MVTGYEIKVSRSDFMNDDKFYAYTEYCNELYFVCPADLIMPDEIPDKLGLIWVSKNAKRLYKKKKAIYDDHPIPEELYRYILMARTVIKRPWSIRLGELSSEERAMYFQRWLETKEINHELGARVSRTLSQAIKKRIFEVADRNEQLRREIESFQAIKDMVVQLGLTPGYVAYLTGDRFRQELDKLINGSLGKYVWRISEAQKTLAELKAEIEKLSLELP